MLHDAAFSGGISAPAPGDAAPRGLCTDCGVSRMEDPGRCGTACQFIRPDYEGMERAVHGRARDEGRADELHFGPFRRMVQARLKVPLEGAQWTGIASRIGARLLETGAVDAVLTVAPDPQDRWKPVPVIVTRPEAMARVRGMRMGFSPLLSLLRSPHGSRGAIGRIAVITAYPWPGLVRCDGIGGGARPFDENLRRPHAVASGTTPRPMRFRPSSLASACPDRP